MSNNDQENLHIMRHSLAHIMAAAIEQLDPGAKFGVGPVVDNGFYYDVRFDKYTVSEESLPKIEAEMKKLIKQNLPFEKVTKPIEEAIQWAKANDQPYKLELLNDLKRAGTTVAKDMDAEELGVVADGESKVAEVSFYKTGGFEDLCRGPHVEFTGKVGAFKLMRVSGAYWRGKEANDQMQRIYGVAFATEKDLRKYLDMLEETKKRDHRKLGQELDLFVFSDLIGAGLPLWTPRGTVMRRELDKFIQEMRSEYGFQEVTVPHITKKDAYIKSGHWKKFKDELFKITTREGHEFAMKPMNCPHHAQIYDSRPRSYRELPVCYRETTMVYRDEQSGELSGLSRVRSITQDDAHVFCRVSQIKDEIEKIWDVVSRFYGAFEIPLKVRLSRHDPVDMSKYLGDEQKWERAEAQLREIVEGKGVEYIDGVGEAAFYGPKIDFIGTDVLGREFQASTIQLDFGQPEGFDLTCIDENGDKERIVMVHCAVSGSLERCLVLLLEHYAGKFPIWLSPEQIRLITVNQDVAIQDFAKSVMQAGSKLGLRIEIDDSNESVGKKIRAAELAKIPYSVVIGDKEVQGGMFTPRVRKDIEVNADHQALTVEEFLQTVANEAKSRVNKTSL
jgi:threonyl-tRNA synthetase